MVDVRRNLQVKQTGVEGDRQIDENGWPDALNDPSDPLKLVVTDGKLGEQREFKAMATSRQDDVSLPEGRSKIQGTSPDDLSIKVKVTELDSTD